MGPIVKERKKDINYIVHRKYTRWKKYEVVCGTALDTQGLLNIYIGLSKDLFIVHSYTTF